MTAPLLHVDGLKKHFLARRSFMDRGESQIVRAVDGVSFTVANGETVGLVGESGCGKSTTAKMLLRLEDPTSGRILFDGREVQSSKGDHLRDYRRQVQAVFQDPYGSLNPRMRVREIVEEPLIAAGATSRAERVERVANAVATVGLPVSALSRFPHEFSGGQRQRIAIARGLILRPRLIVLDEPVSALDVSIRAQILNLLMDLQEQFNITYVFISHDLNVVSRICAKIAVMYLGRIVEMGSAATISSSPRHPYTQALFASVLPDHLDGGPRAEALKGEMPSALNPPSGCHFHTRCPHVMPQCKVEAPPMIHADGRDVACWRVTNESAVDLSSSS